MANVRMQWLLAVCWVAAALAVFVVIDASSTRSWLYLAVVALLPPIAVIRLWPRAAQQTAADVIHGRGGQS